MTIVRSQTWRTTAMLWAISKQRKAKILPQFSQEIDYGGLNRHIQCRDRFISIEQFGLNR